MYNVWMRQLKVILTSQTFNKKIELGTKYDENSGAELNQLDISVECNKYLSALKDKCIIKIKNLSYSEIIPLLKGKYYGLEVQCGYRELGLFTVFKGEVLYMSNNIIDNNTNELVILGSSKLIARFGQNRMNMSVGKGMNVYSVLKFISNRIGITDCNIDESLKNRIIKEPVVISSTIQNFLENVSDEYGCVVSSDSSFSTFSILNPNRNKLRLIKLNNDNIQLERGFPTLDVDGINIYCKPLFKFSPGDVIQVDNSLLNISVSNFTHDFEEFNKEYFLDPNGQYIIFEVDYILNNRGRSFTCSIKGKSKSLLKNLGEVK